MSTHGSQPGDEQLMLGVRGGDAGQLGQLFERHHVALFEFLYHTTGDRTGAEDLVQDVFVRILKYRHTYRDGSPFVTWMYRIARNARADYFRRRQAIRTNLGGLEPVDVAEVDPPADASGVEDRLEWHRHTMLLRQAFNQLPLDKRELIVLARYQRLSHQQIAELLDLDVGAVRVRVHRALKLLRARFDMLVTGRDLCAVRMPSSPSARG